MAKTHVKHNSRHFGQTQGQRVAVGNIIEVKPFKPYRRGAVRNSVWQRTLAVFMEQGGEPTTQQLIPYKEVTP